MSITDKAATFLGALPGVEDDRPHFIIRTPVGPACVDRTRSLGIRAAWSNSNRNSFVRLSQLVAPAADPPQDADVWTGRRERALDPDLEAKEIRS